MRPAFGSLCLRDPPQAATALATASLVIILNSKRLSRRVPGTIIALLAGTIAARAFGLDVETIGTRFSGIPTGLPHLHLPQFRPRLDSRTHPPGDDGGDARRDRIADVGPGRRSHERRRVADTTTVSPVTDEYVQEGHVHILQNKIIPPYVKIFRIHGLFLFGATDKLRPVFDDVRNLPEIVILRLRNMTAIDATGPGAFDELAETLHQSGRHLVLCGARHQPASLIARADFHRHVGDANICRNLEDALNRAREIHEQPKVEPLPPAA